MNFDLNKDEIKMIARGLIMLEKSLGRKTNDKETGDEIVNILTRDIAGAYQLRNKLTQLNLPGTETVDKAKK